MAREAALTVHSAPYQLAICNVSIMSALIFELWEAVMIMTNMHMICYTALGASLSCAIQQ